MPLRYTLIFYVVFFLCIGASSAQEEYSISGKVINPKGKSISFANITLCITSDSTVIKGTTTNEAGEFILPEVKEGNYFLQIFYVGFQSKRVDSITLSQSLSLDPIILRRKPTQLEEIKVVSEKGMFETQAGKMIYNVENNINAVGESAAELLQNIPSVSTDIDDNVTMRGAKATVLIDGVESDLSSMLSQIPSTVIESIEVITNPSAKYESKSGAGIINIKLRKNAKTGYSSKIQAGIGTREKQNLSGLFGYNLKKWKFSTSASYQKNKSEIDLYTERETIKNGKKRTMLQDRKNIKIPSTQFLKTGLSYYFDKKSYLNFQYVLQKKSQENSSSYETEHYNKKDKLLSKLSTTREGKDNNLFNQFSSHYRNTFDDEDDQVLDLNVFFSFNKPLDQYDQLVQPITIDDSNPVNKYSTDTKDYTNKVQLFKFKADYSQPVFLNWKVEMGALFAARHYVQDLNSLKTSFTWNDETNMFDSTVKERDRFFDFNGYSLDSYGLISGKIGKLFVHTGLRFEATFNEAKTDSSVKHNYYKFIPTVHISSERKGKYSWEVSYSSRIIPPKYGQINPIALSWGNYSKTSGNPKLKPEVLHQAEWSNHWIGEKSNFNLALFLRSRSSIISKWYFIEEDEDGKDVTHSKYENVGNVNSIGIDASSRIRLSKFIFRPAITAYYSSISGEKFSPALDRNEISLIGNLHTEYNISDNTLFQFSGKYNSAVISAQGKQFSYFTLNAGIKTKVLKKKGAISLKVTDLFDTQEYDKEVTQRLNYFSRSVVNPHTFLVYLNFSYQFYSMKLKTGGGGKKNGKGKKKGKNKI